MHKKLKLASETYDFAERIKRLVGDLPRDVSIVALNTIGDHPVVKAASIIDPHLFGNELLLGIFKEGDYSNDPIDIYNEYISDVDEEEFPVASHINDLISYGFPFGIVQALYDIPSMPDISPILTEVPEATLIRISKVTAIPMTLWSNLVSYMVFVLFAEVDDAVEIILEAVELSGEFADMGIADMGIEGVVFDGKDNMEFSGPLYNVSQCVTFVYSAIAAAECLDYDTTTYVNVCIEYVCAG